MPNEILPESSQFYCADDQSRIFVTLLRSHLSLDVGGIQMIENKLLHVLSCQMVLGFHLNLVDLYLHLLYRVSRGRIRERLLIAAATTAATATAAAAVAVSTSATTRATRHRRLLRCDHPLG